MFWRPKRPEYLNRIIKLPARSGSRHGAPAPVAARAAADGSRDTRARHGPGDGDDLRGVGRRRGHHQQRGASGGVVPELAPRGGDEQHPGLVQHPRRVPGLRPRLHVRRPVPAGLRGGGARGRRIRRGAGARRRRGGGVGVRHRRHRPQQPPLLRRHGVRGSAVQRDLLRGVCGEGDGAGAAGGAKALREAAGAGHQGGLHHRQARVREGAHCQEPPQRRLPHLGEARAQAVVAGFVGGAVQVRRASEAGRRRVPHRWKHRRPVERPRRRAGGRPHLQGARPHVLRRLKSEIRPASMADRRCSMLAQLHMRMAVYFYFHMME
uniref:Uncharacterized protein n=1 Tax=Setaria italica TaxID=4555 RepID=K3Z805_SETIT